jgi:hypothetical protein
MVMSELVERVAVTIASGSAVSSAAYFNRGRPTVLQMSTDWTAASITFATSPDGSAFYFLHDTEGDIIEVKADKDHRINLPDTLNYTNGLKICSGTKDTPVNQGASRTLYLEVWL